MSKDIESMATTVGLMTRTACYLCGNDTEQFEQGVHIACIKREEFRSSILLDDILSPHRKGESEVPQLRRNGPYIWVTWLTRLLVGENSCEWAAWFRTQHESWSWEKIPSTFDQVGWQLNHTALLAKVRSQLEDQGEIVFTENQNSFTLRGRTATLGGKPDLIASRGDRGVIIDAKAAQPSPSHHIQVMVYMYAVPIALQQYRGVTFDGKVVYSDHEVEIPNSAIDQNFINNLAALILRLSSSVPARKVPSAMECGFCEIPSAVCSERVTGDVITEGETTDF
jgi:hypothetical protein